MEIRGSLSFFGEGKAQDYLIRSEERLLVQFWLGEGGWSDKKLSFV